MRVLRPDALKRHEAESTALGLRHHVGRTVATGVWTTQRLSAVLYRVVYSGVESLHSVPDGVWVQSGRIVRVGIILPVGLRSLSELSGNWGTGHGQALCVLAP